MSSQSYLKIVFFNDNVPKSHEDVFSDKRAFPFCDSPIFQVPVKYFEILTKGDDVKTTYKLGLDMKGIDRDFLPGDTVGILPENDEIVIRDILLRLNLESVAQKRCKLEISEETTKKNPSIPKHLPTEITQIEEIFLKYVDVHTPPKKLFLKSLINFTKDPREIEGLEQITSPKSTQEFSKFITARGRSLLGLLNAFPSCQPPVEILLENLPPLQPRPYSISSSPFQREVLDLVFFVVVHDDGRKGLCTRWLEQICLEEKAKIAFYFRKCTAFRIPQDFSLPMILIATGTGIAPFRGFLQHRSFLKSQNIDIGECWLFYGCRYATRDFLFEDEVGNYLKERILTKFNSSFSREVEGNRRYIQFKIQDNAEEVFSWIQSKSASIFICGNVKTMVKEVKDSIIKLYVKVGEMPVEEADLCLGELEKTHRYFIDTWI